MRSRDAPGSQVAWPSTYLHFPVRSVDSCLEVTAGTPFIIHSVTSLLLPGGPSPCTLPYRASFGYEAASDILPARWHSRAPGTDIPSGRKRCRISHVPHVQTIEPLAACSTPGGLVTTRLAFGNQTPSTVPFGPGDSAVAPVLCDDAHSQVSRVSIGSGFDTQPPYGWQ